MLKDEHKVILYSVIACLFVFLANAFLDRFLFFKESFWDVLVLNVSTFDLIIRMTVLVAFLLYGLVASKIVAKRQRWGEDLLKSKTKIKALLQAIPDSMFRINRDGTLLESVVDRGDDPFMPLNNLVGEKIDAMLPSGIAQRVMDFAGLALELGEVQIFEYELLRRERMGYYEARLIGTGEEEVLVILRDITDRKILEEKLRSQSLTDDLTGLCNRRGFFHLAGHQFKLATRNRKAMLLLYADLDDLKSINDTFGHMEGDRALVTAGNLLKKTFRKSDIIARIGGDEFAVLMIDTIGSDVEEIITERLQKVLKELNAGERFKYNLSFSFGMTRHDPDNPSSIDELLSRADALMYIEKKRKMKAGLSALKAGREEQTSL